MAFESLKKKFRFSVKEHDKKDKSGDTVPRRPGIAVLDDQISIKDPDGGVVTYKLNFLRSRVKKGERAGEDMSLEKRALAAYDKHLAEQRRQLEEQLNRRANRVKSAAKHRKNRQPSSPARALTN